MGEHHVEVTKDQDRWGNPTFTVGIVTVTAYPKHGPYGQIAISDPDFATLQWSPADLRAMGGAFILAAEAAEGRE